MSAEKTILISSLIIIIASIAAKANTVIYVDANANGLNDGTSWQNAYNFLQDALSDANTSSKPIEIWVTAGTYKPDCNWAEPNGTGEREATFSLLNNVAIYGGFPSGGGPWESRNPNDPNNETILSGDLLGNDSQGIDPCDLQNDSNRAENSYHVATSRGTDGTAIIDGFAITGGNANGDCEYQPCYGGGMFNESNSSPSVTNCTFIRNSASVGGGMCNESNSSPSITNCTFIRNLAGRGGGMCNESNSSPIVINCTFSENSVLNESACGGGMYNHDRSSPKIINCIFSKNFASYMGGGMCNYDNSSPMVTKCTFVENWAWAYSGGGIHNFHYSYLTVANCTFTGNKAYGNLDFATSGGAIENGCYSNITITNCIFNKNSAGHGGAICNPIPLDGNVAITNCVFSGNFAHGGFASGSRGGAIYNSGNAAIDNCTFTGNSAFFYEDAYCSGNACYAYGGGIYNDGGVAVDNCTFSGNLAEDGYGGGIHNNSIGMIEIANSVLYNNTASEGNEIALRDSSTADINHNDVKGGQDGVYIEPFCTLIWGPNNIDADPCFVEPGYWDSNGTPADANDDFWVEGNYRLLSDSPCIDAGDNNSVPPDYADLDKDGNTAEPTPLDLDGFARFIDDLCVVDAGNGTPPIVDMGAHEFLRSNINHDGAVDFLDLAVLVDQWLQSPGVPSADIAPQPPCSDGIINFLDFAALAEWWLAGTVF